jgi:hypothetical protein
VRGAHITHAATLLCLVYHEARNVRHPIKAGKLADDPKYAKLMTLPHNRLAAWSAMAKIRQKAAAAVTAEVAAAIFEGEFRIGLAELEGLYRAPCWKGSSLGGNRWAPICAQVRELVKALQLGDDLRASGLLRTIPEMRHNTGTVESKLKGLERESARGGVLLKEGACERQREKR